VNAVQVSLQLGSLVTTVQPPLVDPHEAARRLLSQGRVPTVIVADDDDDIRESLAEALTEENGWKVVQAKDGAEALGLALSIEPDAMVVDQRMPELSGSELISELRARGSTSRFVLITAAQDVQRLASELSIDCYLGKPFSIDDLMHLVARAVAGGC
jgi:two-component system response regulator (stage 0 sporulation protein F)